MTVSEVWTPIDRYDVTGTGYDPAGHIARDGARVRHGDDPHLARLLSAAIACNNAEIYRLDTDWQMVGDPTEGALVTLAYKGWAPLPDAASRVSERPFDADRKRMSVVMRDAGTLTLMAKGAPESILDVCSSVIAKGADPAPLTPEARTNIEQAAEALAAKGRRVLALAARPAQADDTAEENLTFLGLVGMIDLPRPEIHGALRLCRHAGVRVIMITGDAQKTARAIALDIGLDVDEVLTGAQLDQISDDELTARLARNVHFARTAPAHKMRIVKCLQAQEQLVAMTGDGVNDAPALRQADIGIAMGTRGTDVAKDASDLVLLDDNFATIVNAIEEGRRQFANIQRFVRYLLSSNAGEVVAILANLFLGGPLVFLATQILWMNLVTDGVTAVALGMEKSSPDVMEQPPIAKDQPILDAPGLALIFMFGLYTGSVSLWVFYSNLAQGEDLARTMAFTAMVVFEKACVFAFRSFRLPMYRIGYLSNVPLLLALCVMLCLQLAALYWSPLQAVLHTVPLTVSQLAMIGLLALPLIIVPELVKLSGILKRAKTKAT